MKPPYDLTAKIMNLIVSISEKIGVVNSAYLHKPPTELRKKNRIKTIQASLEIEGNTLSVDQITALLNNERVLAPQKDLNEVRNAIEVYDRLNEFDPFDLTSLLKAHELLMRGLVDRAGVLRNKAVGIVKGDELAHLAPPGDMVLPLLSDLYDYLKNDDDLLLLKSCVFHYEFEFIHPFIDGNGRMGRLWQTLILKKYSPIFEFLPVESIIKQRQNEYYNALALADKMGKSTPFIEFVLEVIEQSLTELLESQRKELSGSDRIVVFRDIIGENRFTRQDYMKAFRSISTATASRDLKWAVGAGLLEKSGDKRLSIYHYLNDDSIK